MDLESCLDIESLSQCSLFSQTPNLKGLAFFCCTKEKKLGVLGYFANSRRSAEYLNSVLSLEVEFPDVPNRLKYVVLKFPVVFPLRFCQKQSFLAGIEDRYDCVIIGANKNRQRFYSALGSYLTQYERQQALKN